MIERSKWLAVIAGAAGGAAAVLAMEAFSARAEYPLVAIPFATSIVLVIGSPQVEPAQPQAWSAAAAVGLAVLAMYVTGTFHPPAGINPLLVVSNNLPWTFLFAPVLAGALLLTAFAYVWHRWIRRRPWPHRWV